MDRQPGPRDRIVQAAAELFLARSDAAHSDQVFEQVEGEPGRIGIEVAEVAA